MSTSKLPERASLEYLKKLAKGRLGELRRTDPEAKLASALLAVAREYGFSSWRALKAEIDQRQSAIAKAFFEACATGDVDPLRSSIAAAPTLVHAADAARPHGDWTGLHTAAERGQVGAVRLLLEHGANPNAREAGDNTYPLHWAASKGDVEVVRALLDAGGDVHGFGDVHELDTIGWATVFRRPDAPPSDVLSLLIERGARHHIFSAIAVGDLNLIREVVEDNPEALDRRLSRFEHGQTALHFALNRKRYDIVDLLLELGADVEAEDGNRRTALDVAMLRGDREAMSRLRAVGAQPRPISSVHGFAARMSDLAGSIAKGVPMIMVPDVARALDWYASIGFTEVARYADGGLVNFGMVSFGKAELMLNIHGKPGPHDVSLWFYTDRIDDLYQLVKSRQLEAAQAALDGQASEAEGIAFEQDLEEMFYGARQFCIRDLNGYELYFIQSTES